MTHHLTAEMIAEALDVEHVEIDTDYDEGWACRINFQHKGDGVLRATLWGWDDNRFDHEVECRTFRLVEVES